MWALGGFILFSLALAACQGEGVLFPPAGQTPPATPGAPTPSPFTPLLSQLRNSQRLTPLPHLLVDPAQLNAWMWPSAPVDGELPTWWNPCQ
jgi:hypothetical protein